MEELIESIKRNDYIGITEIDNLENLIKDSIISPLWYMQKSDKYFNESIFTLLVECGADLDCRNNDGQTLLMYCIEKGYNSIVYMLISNDCNLNIQDKTKMSALHYAVYNLDYDLVKILVTCGIDTSLKDNCGHTATQYLLNNFNHQHIENEVVKRRKCLKILQG